MRNILLAMALLFAAVCPAADFSERRTSLPFTYILDYDSGHTDNPEYIRQIAAGPPYLLHLGTDTPCHSYFGAAFDWKRFRAGPQAPPPDYAGEFRGRMASLTRLAADLHKAGARLVTPYICMMTTGGDHEKRTGFWETYDHWDAYAEFGIGPRPEADPVEWIQRQPDGSPKYFYAHEHPPYKPMFRYANCVNNPAWKQYMMWVIRTTAQCGFDGVFVDNSNLQRCYCKHCQEGFRRYLARKYPADQMTQLFGDSPALADKQDDFLWVETQLFWEESIHDFLGEMKAAGAKVHGSFYIFPNALCSRPELALTSVRDTDLGMDEHSTGPCGTHPGMVSEPVIAGISLKQFNDNIFTHRHTQAANALVRSALLTRPGYPKSEPRYEMNASVGALGLAEAAAFSGGGAFLHRPPKSEPFLSEVRLLYNKFFGEHRALYEGLLPYGEVALACFAKQRFFGDSAHVAVASRLLKQAMAEHVLVDLVTEANFQPQVLKRYRALILPNIKYMSEAEVSAATQFASEGKTLLAGEKCGALDDKMRPRKEPPFAGRASGMEWQAVRGVLAAMSPPVLPVIEKNESAELVRLAAYSDDPASPGKVVLHLVNYAVPLGTNSPPPEEIRDLKVSLPLPEGRRAKRLVLAVPGQADRALDVKTEQGRAVFAVPSLRIYAVCELNLEK